MILSNKCLEWDCPVFEFFVSESKSQVNGIESSMIFFSNVEELKDTGIVCVHLFSMYIVSFSHQKFTLAVVC